MTLNLSSYRRCTRTALFILAATLGLSSGAVAQQGPAPKVELFGGYSFFYPNSTLTGTLPGGITPVSSCLCDIPRGAGVSATYNFLPWLGLTADFSGNWAPHEVAPADKISKSSFYSLAAGPKFTYRARHFAPFAEALFGEQRLTPELFQRSDSFGILAGGGIDLPLSRHISIRPIRADFAYSNHSFGINPAVAATDVRGMRLEAGIVFLFGGAAHPKMVPAEAPAPLPPVAAAPAIVYAAPTIVCMAQPSTINAGETSAITATGNSPQGLPLSYSYSSNAGTISGAGSTVTLMSAGASAGVIEVICNVTDSHGQIASQTVPVTVVALAMAPKPAPRDLCSISFARDTRRPVRVDNEAKACLDDVALAMQQQSDATLIITGDAQSGEPGGNRRATERAINTKAYLVTDRGIDPARITLYTGSQGTKSATNVLVPAGAIADTSSKSVIDESSEGHRRP
jgi:hypothetical protein